MLNIGQDATEKAKCYFSQTLLPQYIDAAQPPTKRKPFSSIYAQPFNHSLTLVLPASSATKIQDAITKTVGSLKYLKVQLKLIDILTGDFFNQYIKTGNIILLSAPPTGIEGATISLAAGILKIDLDTPLYQRTGLQGTPIPDANRKHIKSRHRIEVDLRAPAAVSGKKGFERLKWAVENVFVEARDWLFCDLRNTDQTSGPVAGFAPFEREGVAVVDGLEGVRVLGFPEGVVSDDESGRVEMEELLEWLSLVCLDSERVRAADRIDEFLSRYEVPCIGDEVPKVEDLVRVGWSGFMSSLWVARVFMAACNASGDGWFGMQVAGFEGRGLVVLKDGGRTMTWECEG